MPTPEVENLASLREWTLDSLQTFLTTALMQQINKNTPVIIQADYGRSCFFAITRETTELGGTIILNTD